MQERIATELVLDPKGPSSITVDDMIFVFGSNTGGYHGGGAARFAHKEKGAVWGEGIGHFGQSYAIPTKEGHKDKGVRGPLSLAAIEVHIQYFLLYAKAHPELNFQVTCIGCGLAGFQHSDIAPMFSRNQGDELPNLYFDLQWAPYLSPETKFWGTI